MAKTTRALPLSSLNHISRTCLDLRAAGNFYKDVLGFVEIKRPGSFGIDGIWLLNYGIGIHLLQCDHKRSAQGNEIDPESDHISFECEDTNLVEMALKGKSIKYLRRQVQEGRILIDQIFFHDPDGYMIEVCNCDVFPVEPIIHSSKLSSCFSPASIPDSYTIFTAKKLPHEEYAVC